MLEPSLFSCYCCYHKILDNVTKTVLLQAVTIGNAHCISFYSGGPTPYLWLAQVRRGLRGSNTRQMYHPVLCEMRRNQISLIMSTCMLYCPKIVFKAIISAIYCKYIFCEKWLKVGIYKKNNLLVHISGLKVFI